jgi:catechol 2,3-dioxygenase-like lactoylglutathione lyase family enzyme
MVAVNGIHHLAISTSNIKTQIEFFSDVLGMELVALYWMHGADNTWHGFLKLNDHSYIAFVQSPQVGLIKSEEGKTHAANPLTSSAAGTMQHLAFNVNTDDELLAMRDRIRSRGVNVYGYMDHGFCKSIYFAGPEGLLLEVSTSEKGIDNRAWIDPEVVEKTGISADELMRFKKPAAFNHSGAAIPQPPFDPAKPHMTMSPGLKALMVDLSDEELAEASLKFASPPVTV